MINQSILPELKHEGASTRKMLERVPFDKRDWKPHAKSMSLGQLADHLVDVVAWIPFTIQSKEIDWATFKYEGFKSAGEGDLVKGLDKNLADAIAALGAASDDQLMTPWTMRHGDQVYFTMPRVAVLRSFSMNHMIHHRAQLSVYLRLLDVPVPGMYGPTADEMSM